MQIFQVMRIFHSFKCMLTYIFSDHSASDIQRKPFAVDIKST